MILELDGVSFAYGSREVLKNVSFRAARGDLVAVLGRNGSGKSTLLKTIGRILQHRGGAIYIDGHELAHMDRSRLAREVGYLPQQAEVVPYTVFDAVLLGRKPYVKWRAGKEDLSVVERVLKVMGLEGYALRNIANLSGGELQKVFIARALAQEPHVLMLDEPINHLDLKNQIEVMEMLLDVTKDLNILSLVVMHDINSALRFCSRFLMISDGEVLACGGREVINPEMISLIYGIDVVVTELMGVPVVVPRLP